MENKFTTEIVNDNIMKLIDLSSNPDKYQTFSFSVPEGYNKIPVFEQVKYFTEITEGNGNKFETMEKVTRLMIDKKSIEVFMENKSLGKFIFNGSALWDSIPAFCQYPMAARNLINICSSIFVGEFLPPLKNIEAIA